MKKNSERGMALVTAMAAALIISVTAIAVLGMTLRRFELSASRSDHAIALAEAEAGLRYAFARLDLDSAFKTAVQNKAGAEYIIRCHDSATVTEDAIVPALHMGGKHVEVRITYNTAGAGGAARPYKVRAMTSYGTGN